MQAEQSVVVDPKSPGGINSPHGLILLDGVCALCSRGCRFVSKRDRRGYFRFVPMQVAEGRPLAEQLGIDPDRPDSFAFVATGQAYVKSEAALRIARELPRWRWTWVFHFIPGVIRDAIYDLVVRNRYHWFGRRDACMLPNCHRELPPDCGIPLHQSKAEKARVEVDIGLSQRCWVGSLKKWYVPLVYAAISQMMALASGPARGAMWKAQTARRKDERRISVRRVAASRLRLIAAAVR
jgi:predicted DCC family thiol-disulfide oxidoreductase YuxK